MPPSSKAQTVGTTINRQVDRPGDAYEAKDLEDALQRARKLLAEIYTLLEVHSSRLRGERACAQDPKLQDKLDTMIRQVHKNMTLVLEIEVKTGLATKDRDAVDLEEARAEILRRLARLAH